MGKYLPIGLIVIIAVIILLVVGFIMLYNRLQKLRIKVDEGYSGIDIALEKRYDLLSEQIEAVKKYLNHEYSLYTDVTAVRKGAEYDEQMRVQQKNLADEAVRTIDKQISEYSKSMEKIKQQLDHSSRDRIRSRRLNRNEPSQSTAAKGQQLAQNTHFRNQSVNQKVSMLADAHNSLSSIGTGFSALAEQYPILNSWVTMEKFQMSIVNSEEHLQAARRLYNSNVSLYNQTVAAIPWSIVASMLGIKQAYFYEVDDKKRSFTVDFD